MKIAIPIIIVILAVAVILFQNSNKNVCFDSNCIKAEVADDSHERSYGLMYRTSLEENTGMLFIFDFSEKHGFWMKNTLIPLDILWLDENKKVIHMVTAQPCEEEPCLSFAPTRNALYVIETNAGFAEENNIQIGDEVKF